MPDDTAFRPPRPAVAPSDPAPPPEPGTARAAALRPDAVPCDRCGPEMFRMHAVWRCPACGYKTDCCGW
jgi:hypothetical protein